MERQIKSAANSDNEQIEVTSDEGELKITSVPKN